MVAARKDYLFTLKNEHRTMLKLATSEGAALEAQQVERRVIRKGMRHCILDLVGRLPPVHRE